LTRSELAAQFRTQEHVIDELVLLGEIAPLFVLPHINEPRFSVNTYHDYIRNKSSQMSANKNEDLDHKLEASRAASCKTNSNTCTAKPIKAVTETPRRIGGCSKKHELQSPINNEVELNSSIINFLQNFSGSTKVLKGFQGMSIRASKKEKVIQLRAEKHDKYFKLISYPTDHIFTSKDIETLKQAHTRFRSRIDAQMPWKDKNYLLNATYREINTFTELIELYKEGQRKAAINKISRIQRRYFSGSWGDKLVVNYCVESFRTDYLDRPVAGRQPSDRNEIIKITSAAINKAKEQLNVKIDVQPLIKKGERSRSDDTDRAIPKMSTLADFIMEAYQLSRERAGLSMVIQLLASTRAKRTNYQRWERVKLGNKFIEVPSPESKTAFVRHPIPQRLIDILKTEKQRQSHDHRLTKDSHKQPLLMFESEFNRGKPLTKFHDYFNEIKGSLINKAIESGATEEEIDEIKRFQQHRIRDIVEQLLLDVHASEAQKEKCIGRKPSELGRSYGDLSIDKLSKLKDKMVAKIEQEHPDLKALFQSLIDKEIK